MNTLRSARAPYVLALLLTALGLLASIPAAAQRDFYTVDPCRQYDSRGGGGPHNQGTVYSFAVTGAPCGVPANAVAVALNVTIISPGSGYLVVYPAGGTPPGGTPPPVGALSFNQGRTQANNFLANVGTGGQISVNATITPASPGIYHLVIDIAGYFLDNEPSVVGDDEATVLEDSAATPIDVLADDSDPDDTLSITSASDPANGTVLLTPAGPGPYTGLTYQPDANYCNDPPGTTLDTFTYTLNTGATGTVEVTVTCVNDAPAGTDGTIGTGENTERVFTAADFGFTDPNDSPADSLLAVVITTLPGAGTIELSNVAVIAGQSIAVADITAGNLTFTPAAGANGTPYASFTFQVQDDGGTANSGVDLDPTPNTLTINVNSVNDPPAGTDNTITLNEDDSHTFSAADFGFTDPSDTPADAFQAVTITTLPAAGSLTLLAVPVSAGQSIPAGSIGNLVFTPAANANGTPYTSFTFQVQDDGGGTDLDPTPNTITFNVTAVNDAPAGTNNTVTTPEDTQYTFTVADFGLTDPVDTPANALQSVIIATLPGAGSLTLSGNPVSAGQEIPAASITAGNLRFTPAANASGTSYASFTFQVRDDGGTANGGIDLDASANTMTIDVTANNDAPSGTDNTVTTLEETQHTFTVADFGFTDPNDTPANALAAVVITTLPGAGSLTLAGNPVIAGQEIPVASITAGDLRFTPAANGSGSPYASFTFQVRDDGGTTGGGIDLDASPNTMTVNVTPVNDAPAGTSNTVTTLEETPYTFTAANFGFTDPNDTPPNTFASVVITTLPGVGSLTLAGNPVIAGQEILVASIGNLVFTPVANASGISYASFTFQVRDNGGTADSGIDLDPTPNTMTIDVTAVNDAPAGTDNAVTTPEDVQYTFTVADFGFTDPNDTPANALASVVISTLPGAGSLTLSGSGFAAGTEIPVASITGGNLRFLGAANAFGSPYTNFTFRVRDNGGTANSGVDLDPSANTMTINVTPVPDAPLAIDEGTPASPYVETVGNTILEVDPLSDLPGAKVYFNGNILTNDSDPDGPTTFTVTLESATAGAVVTFHPNNGTFTYVPPPGFTGVDSFTYRITDPVDTLSDTATVYVNVEHRVWYVRNNTATPGTAGTSEDPFDTLGEAESASGQNDTIYLFEGDGTTADQSDGITLKNGQRLLGEAVQLAVPTAVNINGTAGLTLRSTTGNRPKIENDNTPDAPGEDNGVSVPATAGNANGVEIRGLEIGGFDNAIDVTASGANTVGITISNNHIRGASTEGIDLNASGTGIFTSTVQNNTWALAGTHTGNAFDARTGIAGANLRVNFSGNVDILTTGGAASAVFIDGTAGGAVTITGFSGNSVHENTAGNGIVVNSATFDADAAAAGFQQVNGGATFIGDPGNGVGNSGIDMNNVSGDLAFTNLGIYADGNLGLRVNGTGAFAGATGTRVTVTAGVGVIEAVNSAVTLSSITADLQLASLKSTGTTTNGVSLTNVSDGGGTNAMFSAGSGSSIIAAAGATGPIFNVSGGNAAITFPGLITNNSTSARAVSLTTWSGNSTNDNITLSGAIDENGAGILVNGTSGTCNGDSDGCPITFSGGMDVDTTTGEGFAATSNTGSVRLHVTGTNTINSLSATALRVTNTTIGSSNLNFQHISSGNNTAAADPANGIVLSNTGSTGGFIVTGSGGSCTEGSSTCTGGWIQNMTGSDDSGATPGGTGIVLNNTANVSLSRMRINDTSNYGIRGTSVAGFTFSNSVVDGANGTNISTPFNEGSLVFFGATGTSSGMTGTSSITNSTIMGGRQRNIAIDNSVGTLNLTVSGSTIKRTSDASGDDGFFLEADTSANVTLALTNNTFARNGGDHINVTLLNNAVMDLTVTGNTLHGNYSGTPEGNHPIGLSQGIFVLGATFNGNFTYEISNNGSIGVPFRGNRQIGAIHVNKGSGTGTFSGRIENNVIGDPALTGSGSSEAFGIIVGARGAGGSHTTLINNNTIRQYFDRGIVLEAGEGSAALNATVTNNTVSNFADGTNSLHGIHSDNGILAGDTNAVCLQISGNSVATAGNEPAGGADIRLRRGSSTTVTLPGVAGATNANATTLLQSNNPTATTITVTGNGFTNGAACPLPL